MYIYIYIYIYTYVKVVSLYGFPQKTCIGAHQKNPFSYNHPSAVEANGCQRKIVVDSSVVFTFIVLFKKAVTSLYIYIYNDVYM